MSHASAVGDTIQSHRDAGDAVPGRLGDDADREAPGARQVDVLRGVVPRDTRTDRQHGG